jgi:hypothetical protein
MSPEDIDQPMRFDAAFFVQERLEFDLNNNDAFDFSISQKKATRSSFISRNSMMKVLGPLLYLLKAASKQKKWERNTEMV